MKILKVEIEGFMAHKERTVIDFGNGAIVGLLGPNGIGKTAILGAGFATFYGMFPPYSQNLYDCMSLGAIEAGLLTTFEHDGQTYQAERKLKKTGSSKSQHAWLRNESGEVIAGPKVGDYEAAINTLVGSKALALATWYFSQKSVGDLCEAAPADRRRIFAEILGLDRLNELSKTHASRATELKGIVEYNEKKLGEFDAAKTQADIEVIEPAIEALQKETSKDLDRIAALKEDIMEAEARQKSANDDLVRIVKHEEALNTISARIGESSSAIEELGRGRLALLDELNSLPKSGDDPATLEIEIDVLEDRKEKAQEAVSHIAERDQILALPGNDPEIIEEAAMLPALDARHEKIVAENAEIEEQRKAYQSEYDRAESQHTAYLATIRSGKPDTPGDDDVCSRCPLVPDMEAAKRGADESAKDMEIYQAKIDELPELDNVGPIEQEIKLSETAKTHVDHFKSKSGRLNELKSLIKSEFVEWSDEDDAALKSLRERYKIAVKAAGRAAIEKQIIRNDAETRRLENELSTMRENRATLMENNFDSADSQKQKIGKIEVEIAEYKNAVETTRTAIDRNKKSISDKTSAIKALRVELERNSNLAVETEAFSAEWENRRTLSTIFGPRGVQPLIVDQAMPVLEEIANELFTDYTDGNFQIRLLTQSANADGSMREDFVIAVRDNKGERDVSQYSGGEMRIIQTILRIAISTWFGMLKGTSPISQIFIDESFDALDGDNVDNLFHLLGSLPDGFQAVVVTHSEELARRLPKTINLNSKWRKAA